MHDPHRAAALPLHHLEVPAPRSLPFAVGSFDGIGPESRAGYPHRHTFHEIVHVTGGVGGHVLDLCRRPLAPPHLILIAPGQVHHWEQARDLEGTVVLFDEAFLLDRPGDRELLRRLGARPWLHLSADAAARVGELLHAMCREYRERQPGAASALRAYLHVLLVTAARLPGDVRERIPGPGPDADADTGEGGARAALCRRFVQLLTREPGAAGRRSVRAWAAELGVSAGYLGEAVRETAGRSPGRLIRSVQVLEAKQLLACTGLTVHRVAGEVGFTDAAYFCRFFKRETGVSPGVFRQEARAGVRMDHGHRVPSIDPVHSAP